MDKEILSFERVRPDSNLIDEIWTFDVNQIETISEVTLVQYITTLAQWLVYYKSQVNQSKAELGVKQSDMEIALNVAIKPELVKEYGTKTAATAYLVTTETDLIGPLHERIRVLKRDLARVSGMDKAITEYINAFKREQDRRRHERDVARMERKI
jgi:hypothetical protein